MKITIIGSGKMGCAMALGLMRAQPAGLEGLTMTNRTGNPPATLKDLTDIRWTKDNREACRNADFIVLAVLPQQYEEVLSDVSAAAPDGACLLSIAPGYSVERLTSLTGGRFSVVRAMPNTPAMIGRGMIAVCENPAVPSRQFEEAVSILSVLGQTEIIQESQLNAVIGISGSAPAYLFVFLDALADAGVLGGLHREQAVRMAVQTMLGAAELAKETALSPAELRDMVCSPAGTTIEAVAALEKNGLRSAVIEATRAAMEKADRMGKKR